MKTLWQYTLKYKYQFFCRIITISLVALASICFDFLMGFIQNPVDLIILLIFLPVVIAINF